MLKNAAANNFAGEIELVPAPINIQGSPSLQPFLTPDCNTLYFATNRGESTGPTIYKSTRIGDTSWSEPELVVKGKTGVGEPTLTDDGQYLFFLQLFKASDGTTTSDIFYTKRK